MTMPLQVTPTEIWPRVLSGQVFLVCAYDDLKKFRENHLEGAMSMAEFRARMKTMEVNQEIVFYCA